MMAINIDMSGYARVRPIITVGSANAIGASIGVGISSPGDVFVNTDIGITSVWDGTAWDDIGPELVQGLAAGEAAVRAAGEQVARDAALAEDEAWVGPDRSVKSRFHELLEQYPNLTRPQAYMQAVMETGEPVIAEAVTRMKAEDNDH